MNEEVFITESSEETQKIAEKIVSRSEILLRRTEGPIIFALFGELGSGKTTFVQGLARGLGIERRIISPTFIILRTYPLKDKNFYHVDLYRIESEKEIDGLGLEEILKSKKDIIAVEWAEKIQNILPDKRINIFFANLGGDKRKITIWKR